MGHCLLYSIIIYSSLDERVLGTSSTTASLAWVLGWQWASGAFIMFRLEMGTPFLRRWNLDLNRGYKNFLKTCCNCPGRLFLCRMEYVQCSSSSKCDLRYTLSRILQIWSRAKTAFYVLTWETFILHHRKCSRGFAVLSTFEGSQLSDTSVSNFG